MAKLARMFITRFLRRIVESLLIAFAVFGFASVPLGERTAFQHLVSILRSEPAREAQQEVQQAGLRFVDKMRKDLSTPPRPVRGEPRLPRLGQAADSNKRARPGHSG